MRISNQVKEVIKKKNSLLKSKSVAKCVKFTREMEELGLICPNNYSASNPAEGGIEQLKLFASDYLNNKPD